MKVLKSVREESKAKSRVVVQNNNKGSSSSSGRVVGLGEIHPMVMAKHEAVRAELKSMHPLLSPSYKSRNANNTKEKRRKISADPNQRCTAEEERRREGSWAQSGRSYGRSAGRRGACERSLTQSCRWAARRRQLHA